MNDGIQKEIEELERELRALKCPQGTINNVQSYSASILNPSSKVRITYSDGNNDIITSIYLIGTAETNKVLTRVKNNIQYILITEDALGIDGYRIVSTRPVLSVENVS